MALCAGKRKFTLRQVPSQRGETWQVKNLRFSFTVRASIPKSSWHCPRCPSGRAGSLEFLKDDQAEILVFVGECEEALAEPVDSDNGADKHSPVDINLTLGVLGIKRHDHLHCHRCRHIAVEVNFGGKTKHRKFSPSTTVGVVTQWARRKFRLDEAAAAEYVLQLCNSVEQPRSDRHLGELVRGSAQSASSR